MKDQDVKEFVVEFQQEFVDPILKSCDLVLKGLESFSKDGSFNKDAMKERFNNLDAIYMPGEIQNHPYEGMSIVNTFRLIFNNYFNANYDLLEDKSYLINTENSTSMDITKFTFE